MKRMFKQWW